MPNEISFQPLSFAGLFHLGEVTVYDYDNDMLLTTCEGGKRHLIHLYENEAEGRTMYGLNLGGAVEIQNPPCFVGSINAVELSFATGDGAWDFKSLTLQASDGSHFKIRRNDDSFPEPTFLRSD